MSEGGDGALVMAQQMEMGTFQMFRMVCNSKALCLRVRFFKQITDVGRIGILCAHAMIVSF